LGGITGVAGGGEVQLAYCTRFGLELSDLHGSPLGSSSGTVKLVARHRCSVCHTRMSTDAATHQWHWPGRATW
jgi:hypothetical protein